jgi:hypothetical protein
LEVDGGRRTLLGDLGWDYLRLSNDFVVGFRVGFQGPVPPLEEVVSSLGLTADLHSRTRTCRHGIFLGLTMATVLEFGVCSKGEGREVGGDRMTFLQGLSLSPWDNLIVPEHLGGMCRWV